MYRTRYVDSIGKFVIDEIPEDEDMAKAVGLYTHDKDPVTGLTKNQQRVLQGIVMEGKTQLAMSEEMGVTRQRIRQIVEELMEKGYEVGTARPRKKAQ